MAPDRPEPDECEMCGEKAVEDSLVWFEGWAGESWMCSECADTAAMEE